MNKLQELRNRSTEISKIARKNSVLSVKLFGSAARGEDQESSDVDLLVTLDPDGTLMDAGGFQYEMEKMLGYRVDVVATRGKNKSDFIRKIEAVSVDIL